jgi:ferredoxin
MTRDPDQLPPTDEASAAGQVSETETVVVRLDGRTHELAYEAGDTLLGAVRRAGLRPPSQCEAGNCATCMALLTQGKAAMRANNALDAGEVEEGYVLTCQAVPTSRKVSVDYDF